MTKHDIIYVLRNGYQGDELRYSIRSVVQNLPYKRIVFVGGTPDGLRPDIGISHQQIGSTKWARSMSSLREALKCDKLTEDVWLFNDDFFVMDRVREDINYFNGTLEKRVIDLKRANPKGSIYARNLDKLRVTLLSSGRDALSFALHVPFLINRKAALDLFDSGADLQMFRSYYGNYYQIPCRYMSDVKVYDLQTIPDTPFISTSDSAFSLGKVGEFLRKYFNKPSRYEIDSPDDIRIMVHERYDEDGGERYE